MRAPGAPPDWVIPDQSLSLSLSLSVSIFSLFFWLHSICDCLLLFMSIFVSHSFSVPDEGLCLSSKICSIKYTLYDKV